MTPTPPTDHPIDHSAAASTTGPHSPPATWLDWVRGVAILAGMGLVLLAAYAAALFRWPAIVLMLVFIVWACVAHYRAPDRGLTGAPPRRAGR